MPTVEFSLMAVSVQIIAGFAESVSAEFLLAGRLSCPEFDERSLKTQLSSNHIWFLLC